MHDVSEAGEGAGKALDGLRPTREDYAVAPILESFNWAECLGSVEDVDWYMVAFRSVRSVDADDRLLYELDALAHAEAIGHSGLLHYFGGELDAERRCVSFCVWQDRTRAAEAAGLPRHAGRHRRSRQHVRLVRARAVPHHRPRRRGHDRGDRATAAVGGAQPSLSAFR